MPIRLRLTLVVAAGTIVLVGLAGLLGPRVLRASLVTAIDEHLAQRSRPIVVVVADPDDSTVDQEDLRDEVAASPDSFVQVLDPSGAVLASSPGLPSRRLVPESVLARLGTSSRVGFEEFLYGAGGERVRMLAVPVDRPDGRYVVTVGSSLATTEAAEDRVRAGLVGGGVVVVLLASLGAWLLAGAALRPVERLRAAVAAVPPDAPGQALQVPATRDELAALAATMNQLLGRISQALERERRLIADTSHELRSPLTVLRTELELANQPGRSRAELAESVREAAREADRVARLAEDLLFLARTDRGGPNVHPVRQPLRPVLAGAVTGASSRAAAAGIRLELEVDPRLKAAIDADRVRQAADNLLDNALRVAPPGSAVRVQAERRDGQVSLAVSDAGPGFAAGFLPHAFERFARADPARSREHGGAGLGLAIVEAIARGHGGHAAAANRPDGGAVVRLTFPGG
jgi:signal transduction histidine kinase